MIVILFIGGVFCAMFLVIVGFIAFSVKDYEKNKKNLFKALKSKNLLLERADLTGGIYRNGTLVKISFVQDEIPKKV